MMALKTILLAASLFAATALPASAGQLNAAQLKGLAPGNYAVSVAWIKMTVNMQPGGKISGVTFKKKKKKSDNGYWTVSGNQLCIRWNRWLKKKTYCTALSGANGTYSGGGLYIRKI